MRHRRPPPERQSPERVRNRKVTILYNTQVFPTSDVSMQNVTSFHQRPVILRLRLRMMLRFGSTNDQPVALAQQHTPEIKPFSAESHNTACQTS